MLCVAPSFALPTYGTNGLPTTFVHDLIVHPREDMVVIATHGRGVYALDARPIQEFGKEKDDDDSEEDAEEEDDEQ